MVRLYEALLALTVVKEECFTRSLQSFVHRKPTLTIRFDGSLSGVGVTWFSRSSDGHETVLGGVAVSLRCLGFGTDTSYQNSAEFIGVVIGIVGALEHGWDTSAIHLRGDSETALKWAEEGRFRSDRVLNAATLISIIGSVYEVHIVGTERIKSEQNWLCDGQSRWNGRERWRSLMHRVGRNNGHFREMKELEVGHLDTILDICDPKKRLEQLGRVREPLEKSVRIRAAYASTQGEVGSGRDTSVKLEPLRVVHGAALIRGHHINAL